MTPGCSAASQLPFQRPLPQLQPLLREQLALVPVAVALAVLPQGGGMRTGESGPAARAAAAQAEQRARLTLLRKRSLRRATGGRWTCCGLAVHCSVAAKAALQQAASAAEGEAAPAAARGASGFSHSLLLTVRALPAAAVLATAATARAMALTARAGLAGAWVRAPSAWAR